MTAPVVIADADTQFAALRAVLRKERVATSFVCHAGPLERLRLTLIDAHLTVAERLIRLRHALRHASTSPDFGVIDDRSLPLHDLEQCVSDAMLQDFGMVRRASGEVSALPWVPTWLDGVDPQKGVDFSAASGAVRPWNHNAPPADPWVKKRLGVDHYRGAGQATAVRSALHLPPGQSLTVVLPTGEGKSLVFQALAKLHQEQLVAVVVPTVALALDQEMTMHSRGADVNRFHAYIGGDEQRTKAILHGLKDQQQRLLFAAPEAYISSLQAPLLDAARTGRLAAVVIDEAHLVEAWGTDFRSDFQWLGALVAELRSVAPADLQPRVICLSATLGQLAFETLEVLFSPERPMHLVTAARLRPEQDLWIASSAESVEVRSHRVVEALRHLPRPAVVYVTTKEDAVWWADRLKSLGFRNTGLVHGDTDARSREDVVRRWKDGRLDVVVGTSAFGLGIDVGNVRTILHACLPENIDRYYQEIGRSGRDNCAAVAILVPAKKDAQIAERLSKKTLIGDEKGRGRWEALFRGARRLQATGHRVLIDVSASPGYDPDMRSGRNEDWNINVLNLLVRAGVIRYAGIDRRKEDGQLLVAVDICDQRHLSQDLWSERVHPLRQRMAEMDRNSHETIRDLLHSRDCPSHLFSKMYGLVHLGANFDVTLACGGCHSCRKSKSAGWFADWPRPTQAPFSVGNLSSAFTKQMDASFRLLVTYRPTDLATRRAQRNLRKLVEALWKAGIHKFVTVGECPQEISDELANRPWCVASSDRVQIASSNGLPPGPICIWIADSVGVPESQLAAACLGSERMLMIPEDAADPRYPGCAIVERMHATPYSTVLEELTQ